MNAVGSGAGQSHPRRQQSARQYRHRAHLVAGRNEDRIRRRLRTSGLLNADGTGKVRLTLDAGQAETSPAWSPDGTKITFVEQS